MANQMTDIDEGSKGGRGSVLIVGIVAACLFAFLIFFGYGGGSKSEAPATPPDHRGASEHRGAGEARSPSAVSAYRASS